VCLFRFELRCVSEVADSCRLSSREVDFVFGGDLRDYASPMHMLFKDPQIVADLNPQVDLCPHRSVVVTEIDRRRVDVMVADCWRAHAISYLTSRRAD